MRPSRKCRLMVTRLKVGTTGWMGNGEGLLDLRRDLSRPLPSLCDGHSLRPASTPQPVDQLRRDRVGEEAAPEWRTNRNTASSTVRW